MVFQLLEDLRRQKIAANRFLTKFLAFAVLFLILDRAWGVILARGLKCYYDLGTPCDVLFVGNSRTKHAVDEGAITANTGLRVAKFAMDGANSKDRLIMLQLYLAECPGPRLIFYDVDAFTFSKPDAPSVNSYQNFYPFMDDPSVRRYVSANSKSWPEWVCRSVLACSRFNERTIQRSFMGYRGSRDSSEGSLNIEDLRSRIARGEFRKISIDPEYLEAFEQTLHVARARNIPLVLFHLPDFQILNQAEPDKYWMVLAKLRTYAAAGTAVRFLDYNASLEGRSELFADPIHVNGAGMDVVSGMLAKDIPLLLENVGPVEQRIR